MKAKCHVKRCVDIKKLNIQSFIMLNTMKFKVQPWKHQLQALKKAEYSNELALFFDMGTGKTATTINILRLKYNQNKRVMRTLIFAPLVVCENWAREIDMHSDIPPHKVAVMNKSGKQRIKKLVEYFLVDRDLIVVTNYESLRNKEFYDILKEWQPEILVCDESHMVKNPKAKQSKAIEKLSDGTSYRYLLTGTPILNSAIDIFQQYRIMDHGDTFGKNFFSFRAKYFRDANAQWSGRPGYFPKWEPVEQLYPELNEKIYNKAMRVMKSDCLDLPDLVHQTVLVPMNPVQKKAYKEMERDFLTFIENNSDKPAAIVANLAITKALKLQQIVTGYVRTEDDQDLDLGQVPRLQVLEELLEQITVDHKCIVWCSFIYNYKQVAKLCEKMGLEFRLLTGEQNSKQKQDSMDDFNESPQVKVMIANRRAGGIGVNLVAASYSIVYSRNFSLNDELQSEARNYRKGSEIHDKITKINLVCPDTIDERVLEALSNKEEMSNKIIGWIKDV